jgi:ABC-type glycerol-3-phosphate transport system substrate-binding protein
MKKQMLSRRRFLGLAAGTTASALLAACQPKEVEVTREVEVEKEVEVTREVEVEKVVTETVVETVVAAPALEGQEGVLWGLAYDPHVEAYHRLAALFQGQTGAKLRVEPQSGALAEKLVAALSAGTQPDLFCLMGKMCGALYVQDVLMPLRDTVYRHLGLSPEEDFFADAIEAYTWEGEVYGVPTEYNRVGSVVNVPVDDVQELGLADQYPPTNGKVFFESYEDMWNLAKALQIEEDGRVVRWGLSSKGWDTSIFLGILRTLLEPQGKEWWDNESKQFNVDTEEGVEAMRLHAELPVELGIETELDQNHVDACLAGKVAIGKGNRTPTLQGAEMGYSFDLAASPKIDDKLPLFIGEGGWGFIAPKTAKNPEVAIEFLRMVATPEGQIEYGRIYDGSPPPLKELVGSRVYFRDASDESPQVKAATILGEHLAPRTRYFGQGFGYINEVVSIGREICSEVRLGNMDSQQAVQVYQEQLEDQYDQYLDDISS